VLRILFLALLLSLSNSAMAVFKCETNSGFIYSDLPCPSGKSTTLKNNSTGFVPTPDGAKAKQQAEKEKKELKRLEKERHQREAKEDKDNKNVARVVASKKSKCTALEQRKRWAEEDASNASEKSLAKAKTKARRAAEKYAATCQSPQGLQ